MSEGERTKVELLEKLLMDNVGRLVDTSCEDAVEFFGISIQLAFITFGISQTFYQYGPMYSSKNQLIVHWLLRVTQTHNRWGFGLCLLHLRNIKGYV